MFEQQQRFTRMILPEAKTTFINLCPTKLKDEMKMAN